jgi:hypothetical protein
MGSLAGQVPGAARPVRTSPGWDRDIWEPDLSKLFHLWALVNSLRQVEEQKIHWLRVGIEGCGEL